jgi:sulfur carrier protein ThiS
MSNIRIDIASEFKDKGFKQADKATTGLEKSFKTLAKTFLTVFSVQQITAFGKASVKAFMEDEAAASRLSKTVANLGLGFEDARIRQFISDLETASGVSDDSLRPAFQALITTTGSVAQSQALLGTALDVSAGSGENLTTVAQDLANAYIGNTRGLKKYNLGLSQAELATMSFEEISKRLNEQFSGQNQANLDTYAGKMSLLKVAFDNMQETIGGGLLDAFQILGGDQGIGGTTTAMEKFGDAVANTTRGVAELVAAFKDVRTYGATLVDFIQAIDIRNPLGSSLGFVTSMGKVKPKPFSTPMTISGSLDSQNKIEAARRKAEAEAAKRAKELLALTKKQVKAQEALNKKKKEDGILGEIAKRFDLERIQVAAALGGQINEVEKLRLELMQAILDEDVKRAIILEGQLIKAEAAAAELATLLDSLDTMVGDPFADWPGTITRIQELLKQLNIKVPIETLFAEKGLKLDQEKMTVTKLERMDVDANNVYINGALMGQNQNIVGNPSALSNDAITEFLAGNPIVIAAVEDHADAILALADAELLLADSLLAESGGNITEIIVNVEGSVISEGDLAETITNMQYEMQRRGQNVLIDSIAI